MNTENVHDAPTPFELSSSLTLPSVLDAYAEAYPQRTLLVTTDRTMSAAEFADSVRSLAASFAALELPRGSAVGILMPNGWRMTTAMLALNYAGLVAAPLNTWYRTAELATARRKAKLKAIVATPNFYGTDYHAMLRDADLLAAADDSEWLGTYLWSEGELPDGLLRRKALTAHHAAQVAPDDVSMHVFTSGSSAEPKVVVVNHEGLVRNPHEMGRRWTLNSSDKIWFAAPMFFGFGCVNALPVALTHGVTLCLEERFDALTSAQFIETNRCTVYYGLGPMTRALVAADVHRKFDISSLRTGPIGFSAEDKRLAVETLGVTGASSVYGLTESYGNCNVTEPGDSLDVVLNTQGTVNSTHRIRCIDPASGTEIAPGDPAQLGEIQLAGCVTPGYLDDEAANAASFSADGWFRTGDLGWIDTDGRLHFAGRLKEVLKINGITISPAEVESYVENHPWVAEAYAFGWNLGSSSEETLCCAVVLEDSVSVELEEARAELRTWLRERVSSYKVPGLFVMLSPGEVPLTATGKVSKRLIGELHVDRRSAADRVR
ncbi:class I adenylate-forming enzyme family protein [Rhodococcus sp. A5(2022)]|uniref:class I adenylate-forming enzyme family protein n=1 Tax=Rhodococcus sp. A5(2022) TaxID=3003588 RepID=UPI0022A86F09|nr:class I adenylate-forming enzyme family protein [Rhodococcus sp. A5(2022)]MCZ1075342.1 class I adenylate-forming enzyme family protein [Rhodococcus sp. A5(2022)]